MTLRHALLVAAVSFAGCEAFAILPADAAPLMCPDVMISDPPNPSSSVSDLLPGQSGTATSSHLRVRIDELRQSGMKPALIVDRLIGAYCPLVAADSTLSDDQKTDRVRRFARQVTELAFVPSDQSEVDVLVEVPLGPGLLSEIDQAAGRAGISRNTWIEQAIKRQLTIP